MAISAAGIIFSSLNNTTLSRMTADRTVAAIPFACRYRLVDFCLSNMVNANISNIYIVANYNYRSLLEHIGSGKDWDLARREGGITMISPFQTAYASTAHTLFSNHMEALKSMKEYITELKEDYVVLMDSDNVLTLDLANVIKTHEQTGAEITFVTKKIDKGFTSKTPKMMFSSVAGKITDIAMSAAYSEKTPELSLNIFVMKTELLRSIVEDADAHSLESLTKMFATAYKHSNYRVYRHDGYAASVSSFLDYYKYSIALAKDPAARDSLLWQKEFPIFTKVHNSAPTVHTENAVVENSIIADECVIEGTVINSVIFRGVHSGRGTVVKDSILFHGTYVEDNVDLNCIVTDKDVHITSGVKLSGNENMPFYVQKKRKI
ncbi:MAG: glucose-1-phosphate adenylyltransferase subunit GlgD [Clostridia bacterium]|nr:glucose-1-phosphate adenylyltransferase subunit GlgD [Clostridia bacterium]